MELKVIDQTESFESLMKKSAAGDRHAYTTLLRNIATLLRPFLNNRLNAGSEVDDVLQEILLSVHKARHTYDGDRPFRPWVFAIANFRLQDFFRTHYADQLRQAIDIAELEEILPEDVTESDFNYESIRGEVDKLPAKQASILRLMHLEGLTAKEVAKKMGMTESAVKVSASRAYKILREKLER